MENILIVGAHYDDTELGAGGTAAKLVRQGKRVYKITLTDRDSIYYKGILSENVGREILNRKSGFILSKDHYLGTDLKKVLINKNVLVVGRIRCW